MFRNRLIKVFRHVGKQANRQGIRCYRVYDHDLPEFPFCIELYADKLYVAEYKRRHNMTEEEHDEWMEQSLLVVSEVLGVRKENILQLAHQTGAVELHSSLRSKVQSKMEFRHPAFGAESYEHYSVKEEEVRGLRMALETDHRPQTKEN